MLLRWRPTLKVDPMKRLSVEAVSSITLHSLYQLGASMAGVFLNLYLWRLTESLFINGMYTLVTYLIGPLAFIVAGKYAKTVDRLFVYRIGIFLTALFYLLVILAGERVVDYYIGFALIAGTSGGFYWLGYLTLMYDVSTDENRIRYLALNSIFFNFAGLIGPAAAGLIISLNDGLRGYMTVFTLAFIMFLVTTIGSFRLKSKGSHHKAYYIKLLPILIRRDRRFFSGLIGWKLLGMYQGLMLLLPNILLYHFLGQEDLVGYMGIGTLGLTILTSYMLSRFARPELARRYIMIAATGFTAGPLLLLIVGMNVWTVLFFIATFFAMAPMLVNSFSAYHYRLVGKLPLKGNLRVETIVAREIFINMGRAVSLIALIFLSTDLESIWLPLIALFAALMQFNFAWIVRDERGT